MHELCIICSYHIKWSRETCCTPEGCGGELLHLLTSLLRVSTELLVFKHTVSSKLALGFLQEKPSGAVAGFLMLPYRGGITATKKCADPGTKY